MAKKSSHEQVFRDLGIEIVSTEKTRRNHYKIVADINGERKIFVASSTPSDHRSILNFTADVKRWKRSLLP